LGYRWIFRTIGDEKTVENLAATLKIPRSLSTVLSSRGITNENEGDLFFHPQLSKLYSPFLMDGMDIAVKRILLAIKRGEVIWIHGDYDVDGTTSTAMMYQFLQSIGAKVGFYIPDRLSEGYGFSVASVDHAIEFNSSLIITVDCGITSVDVIRYAKEKNLETIVCDHHEPAEVLPDAFAILDPLKPNCDYPFKYLSACGVAFKLIQALCDVVSSPEDAYSYLDYVAVASAADIVPLNDENRIMVHFGLRKLNENPRPGFKALVECAGLQLGNLTTSSIIFGLAPRINAAGRVGDARRAVQMMIQKLEINAYHIAQQLEQENRKRRTLDEYTFSEAEKVAQRYLLDNSAKSLVLHSAKWHAGVIGIVASRLVEKHNLPTVMLTSVDGLAKGSARSIKDFDIHSALKQCESFLVEFGGHKHAAGLAIEEKNIDEFRIAFEKVAKNYINDKMVEPEIIIDTELNLDELSPRFFEVLRLFSPFGHNNHKPIFFTKNVKTAAGVKIVGQNHLKFRAIQRNFVIDAIGYHLADKIQYVSGNKEFSIVYTLEENYFKGGMSPQIRIKDIRPSED
jgi:single-stranded-DNA-specific exonuclease